jgi:hypothetical protein
MELMEETGYFLLSFIREVGVILSPLGTCRPPVGLLYQPRMMMIVSMDVGMRTDRSNQNTRRKPTPAPFYTQQIPRDLAWERARDAAILSQQQIASAMVIIVRKS